MADDEITSAVSCEIEGRSQVEAFGLGSGS